MRTLTVALLIVFAFASFASAQAAFTPKVDLALQTNIGYAPTGDKFMEGSYTVLNFGVDADFGNGMVAEGALGIGFGGDIEFIGLGSIETDSNTFAKLRAGVRYTAYNNDMIAVGPLVNLQAFNGRMETAGSETKTTYIGFGIGGFVAAKFEPVSVSASYIYRPSVSATFKDAGSEDEESGTGSTLTISASYPVSDRLTITAGYEQDTLFAYEDDSKEVLSGLKAGVVFAF